MSANGSAGAARSCLPIFACAQTHENHPIIPMITSPINKELLFECWHTGLENIQNDLIYDRLLIRLIRVKHFWSENGTPSENMKHEENNTFHVINLVGSRSSVSYIKQMIA